MAHSFSSIRKVGWSWLEHTRLLNLTTWKFNRNKCRIQKELGTRLCCQLHTFQSQRDDRKSISLEVLFCFVLFSYRLLCLSQHLSTGFSWTLDIYLSAVQVLYNKGLFLSVWKGMKSICWRNICTYMLIAALFTVCKIQKQPRCPLTNNWIKKTQYVSTLEYYLAINRMKFCHLLHYGWNWRKLGYVKCISYRKTIMTCSYLYMEAKILTP